jgi:hypothetical protein
MSDARRLRWSSSSRTALASRLRIAARAGAPAGSGTMHAAGLSTASRAISIACARLIATSSSAARWKRRM